MEATKEGLGCHGLGFDPIELRREAWTENQRPLTKKVFLLFWWKTIIF